GETLVLVGARVERVERGIVKGEVEPGPQHLDQRRDSLTVAGGERRAARLDGRDERVDAFRVFIEYDGIGIVLKEIGHLVPSNAGHGRYEIGITELIQIGHSVGLRRRRLRRRLFLARPGQPQMQRNRRYARSSRERRSPHAAERELMRHGVTARRWRSGRRRRSVTCEEERRREETRERAPGT